MQTQRCLQLRHKEALPGLRVPPQQQLLHAPFMFCHLCHCLGTLQLCLQANAS
jgi:hypothetical protein